MVVLVLSFEVKNSQRAKMIKIVIVRTLVKLGNNLKDFQAGGKETFEALFSTTQSKNQVIKKIISQ